MHKTETTDFPFMKYRGTVYPHRDIRFFRNEQSIRHDKLFETSHSPAIGHYGNSTVSRVGNFYTFDPVSRLLSSGINPSAMLTSHLV